METALDRRLAELITRRRLVTWPDLVRLRDEAMKRGEARAGSPLAAALVRSGTLPAPQVDELLVAALGVSAESSGVRAFFQDSTASTSGAATLPPASPLADPERTVLDAAAPIALPTASVTLAPPRPSSAGLPAVAPRPTSTGVPAVGPRPASTGLPATPPRPAPRTAAADPDDGARTIAAPPAFAQPARRPAPPDADDGARTIAAPPAFSAPSPRPTAPDPDDGARTVAAPLAGGFGAGPAGFGSGPAGFGSGPAGFGEAGFGSGPAGFGSGPAGFGGAPGVHGGQSNGGPRTKAGPTEEEATAAASQRLAAVFQGGRFARKGQVGSDGRVQATDQRIRRPVLLALGPPIALEAAPAHPFFREARLLAAVGHPAVPRVHDAGVDAGRAFVAFDLPEGDRLPGALASKQRPGLPALLRAFLEVTAAVARAHEAGVLHGSLGPQRVVLGDHGRVLVDGWGWARALAGAPAEVDEAAALPPPPAEDDPPRRAPEVAKDRSDARTDVFGLGLILEGMLRGGRSSAPGPLLAIARKALNPVPAGRYLSARALQEDVRRYIDGRSVSAEAESLVGAVARLGRKHPGVAAVAGVLGLLLAAGGAYTANEIRGKRAWVQATVAVVEGERQAAKKSEDAAVAQSRSAKQIRELTRKVASVEVERATARLLWRDLPPAKRGDLEVPATRAKLLAGDRGVASHLQLAIDAAGEGQTQLAEVERTKVVGPEEVRAIADVLVHARGAARLALATFWLREAARTRPDLALAQYRLLAQEPGVSVPLQAEAYLGAYLAARRLAGEQAAGAEALAALAKLEHPLGGLARAMALTQAGPTELERHAAEFEKALEATRERPLSRELGAHFSRQENGQAMIRSLLTASFFEPSDPAPYAEAVSEQNRQSGLYPLWRWSTGTNLTMVLTKSSRAGLEGTPCALDPGPALDAAEYLQQSERKATSLHIVESVVLELEPLAPARPEVRPAFLRARLMLVRARIAAGKEPGLNLDTLEVQPDQEVERHALRVWAALRAGAADRALAAANDTFALMRPKVVNGQARQSREQSAAYNDLADAVTDPEVAPKTIIEFTSPILAGGGPAMFSLGRGLAALRLGRDPGTDLDGVGGQVKQPLDALAATAFARVFHLRQRGNPQSHVLALQIWGDVNHMNWPTESSAVAAKAVIVTRLRDLGRHEAADAFERVDPVNELFVPPAWIPPEAAAWRSP